MGKKQKMYSRFVDNGKLSVLTSAPRENGFPPKCKTSTGNKFDFRSPSPSQKSALLKVPDDAMRNLDYLIMMDTGLCLQVICCALHLDSLNIRPAEDDQVARLLRSSCSSEASVGGFMD